MTSLEENNLGGNSRMRNSRLLFFCFLFIYSFISVFAGEYDDKIIEQQKIISQDPTNLDAMYALGNYLAWDGRHDEAIKIFDDILIKEPKYEDAEIGIAQVYAWKGDQDAAIRKYNDILAKNPNNFRAYQGLGSLALWINDFEKSISYFKSALEITPDDIVSLKGIGRAYLGRGDRRVAEVYFAKAEIQELKKTPILFVLVIVVGLIIIIILIFFIVRRRVRLHKKENLLMELKILRLTISLYNQKTGKFPLFLEALLQEKWRSPWDTADRPFLEGMRQGERDFIIDPFGERYWYNPDTGMVRSTSKGCEEW